MSFTVRYHDGRGPTKRLPCARDDSWTDDPDRIYHFATKLDARLYLRRFYNKNHDYFKIRPGEKKRYSIKEQS